MRRRSVNQEVTREEVMAILAGVFLGVSTLLVVCQFGPCYGMIPFVAVLFYGPCVVLHELGHAWGAMLVGESVRYIRIGKPRPNAVPRHLKFLGFTWLIYGYPFSGAMHPFVCSPKYYRLRTCLHVAAGPAVNLVLFAFALPIALNSQSDSIIIASAGLMFANVILLLYAVPPRRYRIQGIDQPNDGLLIYQTIKYKPSDISAMVTYSQIEKALIQDSEEAQFLPLEELLSRQQAEPNNLGILWGLSVRLQKARDARASEYALRLIQHPKLADSHAIVLIDHYLTHQLMKGPPDDPVIADSLSQRLVALENTVSTRGTRGSVLVDIGRIHEGKQILQEVIVKTSSVVDLGFSHLFLALAFKAEGNFELAREHAKKSFKVHPANPALKRIEDMRHAAAAG